MTPCAETEPFDSPCKNYASNVSDSDSAPVVSRGREVAGFQLAPILPPQHGSQRHHHQGGFKAGAKTAFRMSVWVVRWRGGGKVRRDHHSLSAAARGGNGDAGTSPLFVSRCRGFARGWSIVCVHRVSTRSLSRGAAPVGAAPPPRNPFIVLTRATIALAFYPRRPMADFRRSVLHRGGQAPLKPEQMQPGPQPGRMSHRKGRPGTDRNGTDLPPSCFFMCPSPPCLFQTLAGRATNAVRRKEHHGVRPGPLAMARPACAGVCRSSE
jgi:hypothetical protein